MAANPRARPRSSGHCRRRATARPAIAAARRRARSPAGCRCRAEILPAASNAAAPDRSACDDEAHHLRRLQVADAVRAKRRSRVVHDARAQMAHVEVDGVAKDQDLHQRQCRRSCRRSGDRAATGGPLCWQWPCVKMRCGVHAAPPWLSSGRERCRDEDVFEAGASRLTFARLPACSAWRTVTAAALAARSSSTCKL